MNMNLFSISILYVSLFKLALATPADTITSTYSTAPSLATPFPCTGFCTDLQDTTVIRSPNGTLYRFSAFSNITTATASSFNGSWTLSANGALWNASPSPGIFSVLPAVQNFWSPQVIQFNGLYYLYYVAQNFAAGPKVNCSHAIIGVATSTTLEPGSWTDHGSVGIPVPAGMTKNACKDRKYAQIGPSVLVDNGNIYLSFGSYLSSTVGIPLANPPLTVQPNIQPTPLVADDFTPGPAPNNRSEGSFLWKRAGTGTYYLFYSDGSCCAEASASVDTVYKIKYCTAGVPLGPYRTRDGTSCLSGQGGDLLMGSHGDVRAPGSVSVYQDEVEGLVMVYQWINASSGVEGIKGITFGWNYLGFDEDGVPLLSETKFVDDAGATTTSAGAAATSRLASEGGSNLQGLSQVFGFSWGTLLFLVDLLFF